MPIPCPGTNRVIFLPFSVRKRNSHFNVRSNIFHLRISLVMATRPLKTHEIQGALSICLEDGSINFEDRRSVTPLDELLGPIVEVHLDDSINFIHPTARE